MNPDGATYPDFLYIYRVPGMRDKLWRHKKMWSKYLRRLKLYGFTVNDNQHVFRSHGKPCSCFLCSGEKYSRKIKHKLYGTEISDFKE